MDDPVTAPAPVKPLTRLWIYVLRGGFVVVVAVWIFFEVKEAELAAAVGSVASDARTWLLVCAWIMLPTGLTLLWREQIRMVCGFAPSPDDAFRIQALAWAGRYLPGKAGLWIAKVGMLDDRRFPPGLLVATVVTEQVLFIIAGAMVGFALLALQAKHWLMEIKRLLDSGSFWISDVIGILIVMSLLGIAVAISARNGLRNWNRRAWSRLPGAAGLCVLLAGHGLLHLMLGLLTYPLLAYLLPASAESLGVWGTVGAVAMANVAGIAAIFAPAGIGVREIVLAFFFSAGSPVGDALAFAALLRVLTLIADAGFSTVAWSIPMMLKLRSDQKRA